MGTFGKADIMATGQACLEHNAYFTGWNWEYQKYIGGDPGRPATVKKLRYWECAQPGDEESCPMFGNCIKHPDLQCPEDVPDWAGDPERQLQVSTTAPYLNPTMDHGWPFLPDDYYWDEVDWSIVPNDD